MTAGSADYSKHQVFISFCRSEEDSAGTDLRVADQVCAALEDAGIPCWIDHRDIAPGRIWPDEISKAISQAKIMVLVLSSKSEKSQYIGMEVTQAIDEHKTIIPFCIEDFSLKGGLKLQLSNYQWVIAHPEPKDEHFGRLSNEVREQ
jgi:hypothetical protein